ncbi:DUF6891 domain-containing protein [Allorhizocola rhizosphaerae]|uniref:DUF6891 domain-containing protein n=1 Tax=Allorhizocola rhizosphaerae TaxID=1872709 RepID=UPI000E3E5C55|nr:hypothetical protein [Allorhizocola rhizosphaerae]
MTEDLREYVRLQVAIGYDDGHVIAEDTIESFEDEYSGEDLPGTVAALVEQEWMTHLLSQPPHTQITDCDRLDAAFADLEDAGVVARQHFACCQSCGNAEISAEIADTPGAHGYVYFHMQDTESAADGGSLYLCYGSAGPDVDPVAVGHQVVETLRRHGLRTAWNGEHSQRIAVNLRWQRRHLWLRANCASGREVEDPSEGGILELLGQVATGEEAYFVLLKPGKATPGLFAQAALADDGRFMVEHRDEVGHFQSLTSDRAAAHAALTGWAFDLDGWRDHLLWTRLDQNERP